MKICCIAAKHSIKTISTGLDHVTNLGEGNIADVKYINLAGMSSDKPWNGVNIMLTTYNDGSVDAIKVHHLNGSL